MAGSWLTRIGRTILHTDSFELLVAPAIADLQVDSSMAAYATVWISLVYAWGADFDGDLRYVLDDVSTVGALILIQACYYSGMLMVLVAGMSVSQVLAAVVRGDSPQFLFCVLLVLVASTTPTLLCFWPPRRVRDQGPSPEQGGRVLELLDVSKSYRGVAAVRRLSLTAAPGQVIGLLGPNGSGKSTTVRMIIGLLRPSSGIVRWCGKNIQDQLLDYQALVGYVPEEPRLYTYLTAIEYLELVGGLRDIPKATLTQRIERYLDLFGLEGARHSPLSAFSKGMRQKVLLSAALLHDPAIVVLDEPNSGLDVASSLILRTIVNTLASRGKVIIYSSHMLDAVEKVCQEVVILHKSHVVACNSVARLREMTVGGTLEEAFAKVAVDQNVDQIGRDLADVATV